MALEGEDNVNGYYEQGKTNIYINTIMFTIPLISFQWEQWFY